MYNKMEKIYVLTETDSTDSKWCHNQTFTTKEKAVAEMKRLYHENVIEREELVVKSDFNAEEGKAYGDMVDGIIIAWNITECELQ